MMECEWEAFLQSQIAQKLIVFEDFWQHEFTASPRILPAYEIEVASADAQHGLIQLEVPPDPARVALDPMLRRLCPERKGALPAKWTYSSIFVL